MTYTLHSNTQNDQFLDSLPPCNLEIEEQVLGGVLLQPEVISVIKFLPAEVFYIESHQKIYRAFLRIDKEGKEANLSNVKSYLEDKKQLNKIGGAAKLAQLATRTVTALHIRDHANILIDKWLRRQAIELGQKITQSGYESPASTDHLLNSLEEQVKELTETSTLYYGEKVDPDYQKYNRLLSTVRECEVECHDPGYKAYTMQAIAKEYGRTVKQIEDIYFKHLIHTEQEPLMTLNQLIEKYGSEVREWLMHGFIPKGSTILLHAPGGKGKTRLGYNFFYHLATGSNWDGFPVTAPQRKCMIIQTDEPGFDMVQAVRDRGFEDWMPVLYRTKWQTDHMAYLREEIERERPDIVLIDSLSSINRNSVFTENDAEYARPILLLRDIAQEFNCTFMIVHHSTKSGDARGTSAIFNSVSEVWKLESDPDSPAPDSTDRIFTIEKSRTRRPARYKLEFNPEDKSWSCLGEYEYIKNAEQNPEAEAKLNLRDRVCQFLTENAPTRFECEEINDSVGGSIGSIRRACGELNADGVISANPSPRDRRKKIYWVGIESDHRDQKPDHQPDHQSDPIASDQETIGSDDQKISANHGESSQSDHLITQNEEKSDQESSQKRDHLKNDDQHFTDSPPEKDSGSDHRSDHKKYYADQIGSNDQVFKIGDRVELTSEAPFSGKGFITQVHPSDQYEICLEETSDLTVIKGSMIKLVKRNQVWGTKKDLPIFVIERLVIGYLQENGESEEYQIICDIGQKSPAIQTALKNVATQTRQEHKGGHFETYWQLGGGDGNG